MPDVIFNEPRITERQRQEMRETSSFVNWLIRRGIAKDEKQAVVISLVFVTVAIVVSLFLFFGLGGEESVSPKIMDNNFNPTGI